MTKKSQTLKTLVLFVAVLFSSLQMHAQKDPEAALLKKQGVDAKAFINSTLNVIKAAISAKKANKKDPKSTEPFIGLAYDYQKKAVELYNAGNIEGSIFHALKARKLAIMGIKNNKGDVQDAHQVDEEKLFKNFNKDKDFLKGVKRDMKNVKGQEMPSIDSFLESGVAVSTEEPDVKNPKALTETDKLCKVK